MANPDIVVLAIDGLRASALGAYGNTWFPTPQLDELAADSFVGDSCFASAVELDAIYRALWFGLHPMRAANTCPAQTSLAHEMALMGYETVLLSDDEQLSQFPGVQDFQQFDWVGSSEPTHAAEKVSETQVARLMEAAGRLLGERLSHTAERAGQFIWIHMRGMYGAWDAPLDWRAAFGDEDDPLPYAGTRSPFLTVDRAEQPDALFRYACSYAAQVQVLDTCLGALLDSLPVEIVIERDEEQCEFMLCVQGVRGFPLCEHGQIGGVDDRLFVEQLHVPLLIRTPDRRGRLARCRQIVEPSDLPATLLDLARVDERSTDFADGRSLRELICGGSPEWRDHSLAVGSTGRRVLRTPSWSMHLGAGHDALHSTESAINASKLFVWPDDRFEVNDVAQLRPEVVEGLSAACDTFEQRCEQQPPLRSPALPESLVLSLE